MKRLALALALLGGCAQTGAFRGPPGMTQAQMSRDVAACELLAEDANWGYSGIRGNNRYVRLYDNCMLAKGYERK